MSDGVARTGSDAVHTAGGLPPTPQRTIGGWIWFALMLGGWSVFLFLACGAEDTLSKMWRDLQALPLALELLTWLLLFPLVLATAVWESSWETGVRIALVLLFVLAWSAAFFPRKQARRASGPRDATT